MMARRRAFILPLVLVVIGLLTLTMASFVFFIRAETEGTLAFNQAQQARLAAESGLEMVTAVIRLDPHNARAWYDVPNVFRHGLVAAELYDRDSDPVRETGSREQILPQGVLAAPAWRFSVVGDSFVELADSESATMRFGITPEASKLHLNYATEGQLRQLMTPLFMDLGIDNTEELLAAVLDWRDEDSETREGGAENDYYQTLEPPYNAKNGPFDSVEELLLVKGFSAALLYGEDVNRNGILDPNENDGEESFPYYDNGDGTLNRGIAPFLTTWTREPDTALDNKARINLNADLAAIQAAMATSLTEEELEILTPAIAYISQLKGQNFNFTQLASVGELYQGADASDEGEATGGGALAGSPITLEQLPYLVDRFSVLSTEQTSAGIAGLININTAPARVLALIPGISADVAATLVETRNGLDAEQLRTPAWPITSEAVDVATFHALAAYTTTKAYQFHVEVLGYADHVQASSRIEWIVEMAGPIAQVRYRRNLSRLGWAWPVDDVEIAGEGVSVETGF